VPQAIRRFHRHILQFSFLIRICFGRYSVGIDLDQGKLESFVGLVVVQEQILFTFNNGVIAYAIT
jgi:hypothetical protein